MRKLRILGVLAVVLAVGAVVAGSSFAQAEKCGLSDRSTDEVLPGVTLTWGSSFHCTNAPDAGTYKIKVRVRNAASSAQAVTIDDLRLKKTTPRPRGQRPDATAEASGLPITVAPGESDRFSVRGSYELASTDEGDKANLHLSSRAHGVQGRDAFKLGINVHLRGSGAVED